MLFEKGLIQILKLCLLNNNMGNSEDKLGNNKIHIIGLDETLNNLLKNNYRRLFIDDIYKLHHGNLIGI